MTLAEKIAKRIELLNSIKTARNDGTAVDALTALVSEAEALSAEIVAEERADALVASLESPARPQIKPSPVASAPVRKPTREAQVDAFYAALPRGERALVAAANDIFQEAVPADGGYVIPVDKRELMKLIAPEGMVHTLCDTIFTGSNAVTLPLDEDAPWSASLDAGDVAEGAALTEEKIAFTTKTFTLSKAGALARVTNEMLSDVSGFGGYVQGKLGDKLSWKLHARAIAAFLASPAKKTIAKTVAAAAGSAPDLANVQAMWGGMLAQHKASAVWLANPLLEASLQNLRLADANGNVFPVYIPAGGISDSPYAKLYGRPIYFVEGMPAVGTEGDLSLVCPQTFYQVLKASGPRIEYSTEAEFKNDVVLYRGYIRSVCASKHTGLITRADGTTAGNVLTVGTRA